MTSGNISVDQMAQINFVGDIIPPIWYQRIKKAEGKADFLAINILANICYWYRPVVVRDEQTDIVVEVKKKFKGDMLQKQYQDFADHFGCPKTSVKSSMDTLEELGLIKRHFEEISLENGTKLNNRMFIEIFPDKILDITFNETPQKKSGTLPQKSMGGSPKKVMETPPKKSEYTNNTTEITTENTATTSEPVVDDTTREIFSGLDTKLDDRQIRKIVNEANGNITLCKSAVNFIKNYKGFIHNLPGLIISYIHNGGYTAISCSSNSSSGSYGYMRSNYNWDYMDWETDHFHDDDKKLIENAEKVLGYSLSESQRNDRPKIFQLVENKFREKTCNVALCEG